MRRRIENSNALIVEKGKGRGWETRRRGEELKTNVSRASQLFAISGVNNDPWAGRTSVTFPKRGKGGHGGEALENLLGNEALCRSSRSFFTECNFSLAIGASTSPRLPPPLPSFAAPRLSTDSSKNVIVFPQPLNSPIPCAVSFPQQRSDGKKRRNRPTPRGDPIRSDSAFRFGCFHEFFPVN